MNYNNKSSIVTRIADEMWNQGWIDIGDEIMEADAKYHGPHMPNGVVNYKIGNVQFECTALLFLIHTLSMKT